ncbi:MAG: ABC transporter permease [Firmicutes bacterium]|nr:ABC transporter permease [Bacillota bacterium]
MSALPLVPAPARRLRHWWSYETMLLAVLLLLVAGLTFTIPHRFWAPANVSTLFLDTAITAVPAIGMTMVILTGGIDVSTGAVLGLAATVVGLVYQAVPDWWLAAAAGLLVAGVAGAINGLLIVGARIPPIIVTLGFLSIWRATIYALLGGNWITDIPPQFTAFFVTPRLAGIPLAFGFALLAVGLAALFLARRPWGRYLYAVGNHPEAARVAGLPVGAVTAMAYTVLGLLAGVAALMRLGESPLVQATTGSGFELTVIAAVVIGGTDILGGRGSVWGSLLGAFLVELSSDVVVLSHIQAFWKGVVLGVLILAAVWAGSAIRRRVDRGDS